MAIETTELGGIASLPDEILLQIFSVLNNVDYGRISTVSRAFLRLSAVARWQNISSLSHQEQLRLFAKLCLKVSDMNKQNINNDETTFYTEQLESYFRNPRRRRIETSALAITALAILYELTNASADKIQICENQLHFTFELVEGNNRLGFELTRLLRKVQNIFMDYVLYDYSFESLVEHSNIRLYSLSEYKTSTQNDFLILLTDINHFDYDLQPVESAKKIAILWPQLSGKARGHALSRFLYFLERADVKIGYKIHVSEILANIIPSLDGGLRKDVFNRCLAWLVTQPDVAIEFLTFIWSSLSKKEQDESYDSLTFHFSEDKEKLCQAAHLMWPYLSNTEQLNIFDKILSLLGEGKYHSEKFTRNTYKISISAKSLTRLEPQLTDEQRKNALYDLVLAYKEGIYPFQQELSAAIWLFSKGDSRSIEPNGFFRGYDRKFIFGCKMTLVEQLKEIGKSHHDDPEKKYTHAKKIIDLCCQQCPDLNTLRNLKDAVEQSHDSNELAYVVKRTPHFFGSTFSLRRHQWQSMNSNSKQPETYNCSKEWTECMQIFKDHMDKYKEQFNSDDDRFLGQTGSGWYDYKI